MTLFRLLPRCVKTVNFIKKGLLPSQVIKINQAKYFTHEVFKDEHTTPAHNDLVDAVKRRFKEISKCQNCLYGREYIWECTPSSDWKSFKNNDETPLYKSDFAIWCPGVGINKYKSTIKRTPVLVIEVLSPQNYLKDLQDYWEDDYAQAGVKYYGIIHPVKEVATFAKLSTKKVIFEGKVIDKPIYEEMKDVDNLDLHDDCQLSIADLWSGKIISYDVIRHFSHHWFDEVDPYKKKKRR